MRAAILVAGFVVASAAFAAEPQLLKVASVSTTQEQKALMTPAKTRAPVHVWKVDKSCCEPQ